MEHRLLEQSDITIKFSRPNYLNTASCCTHCALQQFIPLSFKAGKHTNLTDNLDVSGFVFKVLTPKRTQNSQVIKGFNSNKK